MNRIATLVAFLLVAVPGALPAQTPPQTPAPAPDPVPAPAAVAPAPVPAVAAPAAPLEPLVRYEEPVVFRFRGGTTLKLYGRIEMLTIYDSTIPVVADWLAYVDRKGAPHGREGAFNMSVRASPIGLHITTPDLFPGWTLNAKVEGDFVGGFITGANSVYSPLFRLRQSWVSLDHKHFGILLGQGFATLGPLFPDTSNWIALGTSGNPWIRLPQIRLTFKYDPVRFEFAINRPMGSNEVFSDGVNDTLSDGEMSRMPFFTGRLGVEQSWPNRIAISAGASGVYGRERVFRAIDPTPTATKAGPVGADGQPTTIPDPDSARVGLVDKARAGTAGIETLDRTVDVWMFVADLKLATKYVDLLGEFYIGDNLNTFYAGVLQGISIFERRAGGVASWDVRSIRSMGGWGQVTVRPIPTLMINLGAGIDQPRAGDLASPDEAVRSAGAKAAIPRTQNLTAYGNVMYRIIGGWIVGGECNWTRTSYQDETQTNANWRGLIKTAFSW